MCQTLAEGGRRCPCDGSQKRRLRKHNSEAIQYNMVKAVPSFSAKETPSYTVLNSTVGSAKEEISNLEKLTAQYTYISNRPWATGPYECVEGEEKFTFQRRLEALDFLIEAQERQVTKIGSIVDSVAMERIGFTENTVWEYNLELTKEALAELSRYDADPEHYFLTEKEAESYDLLKQKLPLVKAQLQKVLPNADKFIFNGKVTVSPKTEEEAVLISNYEQALANFSALEKKSKTSLDRVSKEAASLVSPDGEPHPKVLEKQMLLAASYAEVLKEIRPIGGELKVAANSDPKASELLQEAAQVYPTDWLKNSNEAIEMRAKKTVRRAHYNHNTVQTKKVRDIRYSQQYKPNNWSPNLDDPHESGWIKIEGNEFVTPVGYTYEFEIKQGESRWAAPIIERFNPIHHSFKNGIPVGHGWQQKNGKWFRPVTVLREAELATQAEITVAGLAKSSKVPFSGKAKAIAIHELAHRVESTRGPIIRTMEEAFLKRRTTSESKEQEPLVQIYPGTTEIGRKDNFINLYMGKVYSGTGDREVLSTGSEAIFGGRYGGLVGGAGVPADHDMKRFILGLFASA